MEPLGDQNFKVAIDESSEGRLADVKCIKNDLIAFAEDHARPLLAKYIMNRFHTHKFQIDKISPSNANNQTQNKGVDDNSFYFFIQRASVKAKTKYDNEKKKEKRQAKNKGFIPPAVKKTKVDFKQPVNFHSLEFSETHDLYNLVHAESELRKIKLDDDKRKIKDEETAFGILKGRDIHLLINIASNSMLKFNFSDQEKLSIQAFRLVRNTLNHSDDDTTLQMLKHAAELFSQALHCLDPENWVTLHQNICECFNEAKSSDRPSAPPQSPSSLATDGTTLSSLPSLRCDQLATSKKGKIFKESLRAELIKNAPVSPLLSRKFTIHFDGTDPLIRTTSSLCDYLSSQLTGQSVGHIELQIGGSACSGRSSALKDIYKHWAVQGSKIHESFKILLPLLNMSSPLHENENFSLTQLMIEAGLREYAPGILQKYSLRDIFQYLQEDCSDVLVLADTSDGNKLHKFEWHGHCVSTSLLNEREFEKKKSPEDCNEMSANIALNLCEKTFRVAVLHTLTDDDVRNELKDSEFRNTFLELYDQFQDQKLLQYPEMLKAFIKVIHENKNNIELAMMKHVVENAHSRALNDYPPDEAQSKVDEMETLAFQCIYLNWTSFRKEKLPFLPSYFDGSLEGPFYRKSLFIEEYLAARYVVKNRNSAGWDWLKEPFRFKRVFKFVVQMLHETKRLAEHDSFLRNYLSAFFGLYYYASKKPKIRGPRSDNWTLEEEGFERSTGSHFRQWGFLSHIVMACDCDKKVLAIIRECLDNCNSWHFNLHKFSEYHMPNLSKILKKMDVSTQSPLIQLKIMSGVNHCGILPDLIDSLSSMANIASTYFLEIILFYDSKRPQSVMNDEVEIQLKKSLQRLSGLSIPVESYDGPFISPSSFTFSAPNFSKLSLLKITVYQEECLRKVLDTYPPTLEHLNLNIDFSRKEETIFRKQRTCSSSDRLRTSKTRVNVAVRFYGNFQELKLLSIIPCIHVLKLHGVYCPDAMKDKNALDSSLFRDLTSLKVSLLLIKFAKTDYCAKDYREEDVPWFYQIILQLAHFVADADRVMIAQLPESLETVNRSDELPDLTYFVHQLMHKLINLQRLVITECKVSIREASHLLALLNNKAERTSNLSLSLAEWCCSCADLPVKQRHPGCVQHCKSLLYDLSAEVQHFLEPRLSLEEREHQQQNKVNGIELLITKAKLKVSSTQVNKEDNFVLEEPDESFYREIPNLVHQAQTSKLARFCFDEKCNVIRSKDSSNDPVSSDNKCSMFENKGLEILITSSQDIRFHLNILELSDEVILHLVQNKHVDSTASRRVSALLQTFAKAQYLKLNTGHLSSLSMLRFTNLLHNKKAELLSHSENRCVAPFHVTLGSRFEEESYQKKKSFGNRQHPDCSLDKPEDTRRKKDSNKHPRKNFHAGTHKEKSLKDLLEREFDKLKNDLTELDTQSDSDFEYSYLSYFHAIYLSKNDLEKFHGTFKKSHKKHIYVKY